MSCIVKLCDICECSLLGRVSISHSSTVYECIHIQAIIEQMMDPFNMCLHVSVHARERVCMCVYVCR